jgi:hypothetical protein
MCRAHPADHVHYGKAVDRRRSCPAPQEDRAAAKAQELGGTVVLPPMDVPAGRFTIVADPQGAAFIATAVPGGPVRGVDGS